MKRDFQQSLLHGFVCVRRIAEYCLDGKPQAMHVRADQFRERRFVSGEGVGYQISFQVQKP